jgi:RHS repeat-associated protein
MFSKPVLAIIFTIIICSAFSGFAPVYGQNVKYTEGATDQTLRSNLKVDPSTLGLSFQIPLGGYQGRGVNLPVSLHYGSKVWRINFLDHFETAAVETRTEGRYAETSRAGWTTSLDIPWVGSLSVGPYDGLGAPICNSPQCYPPPDPTTAVLCMWSRAMLHMPDGSSHELRKSDSPGNCTETISGVYVAVDGSQIRYDSSASTVYLPDGSRYLLDVAGGTQVQYIDKNGNILTYTKSAKQWTDMLGRSFTVPPLPDEDEASADVSYSLPGVGGGAMSYTFRWRRLHEIISPYTFPGAVRPIADRDYTEANSPKLHNVPSLFQKVGTVEFVVSNGPPFTTSMGGYHDPTVLYQIVLPNGQAYTFDYNIYGEIAKVTYPTGSYEEFTYAGLPGLHSSLIPSIYNQANRGVVSRKVSAKGDGSDVVEWTYSATNTGWYVVRTTAPNGNYMERRLHVGKIPDDDVKFGFDDARSGMAHDERAYSASGQLLRRTLTKWEVSGPFDYGATRNPRVTKVVEILLDTGADALTKTTTMEYDADLNVNKTSHYSYTTVSQTVATSNPADFHATTINSFIDSFPLGSLLRAEETTYLVNDPNIDLGLRNSYRARNLIASPSKSLLKNGSNTVVVAAEYRYDESAYPLTTYPLVSGWTDPQTAYRGNVTTVRRWLDSDSSAHQPWNGWTSGTWIETHTWYDQCGNPVKVRDAANFDTVSSYADNFYGADPQNTYAYLTSVTTPGPALTTSTKHDFSTGLVREVTDPNNVKTRYDYNDPLNRLTQTVRAEGTSVQNQTTIQYDDINRIVTTTGDRDTFGDNLLKSEVVYDGLGRTVESRKYETASSFIAVNTVYDALGRPSQVSNPRRSGDPELSTTTEYDSLSRVTRVTTPDGAQVNTQYSGDQVTVTDQAGKKRMSKTAALGRLTSVIEDPGVLDYVTTYSYDALGNLLVVDQGGQSRYFAYDSLSRLIRAKQPEHEVNDALSYNDPQGGCCWSMAYKYDANGNLKEKTDARNIKTIYAYDALNRNTSVDYSNTTTLNPDITHVYDNANPGAYGKGRLWSSYARGDFTNGADTDHTAIDGYDALGRPLSVRQHFKVNGVWKPGVSVGYTSSVTYDLAGNVKTMTYPSGRTVNYSYDGAGRLSSFTGKLGDGQLRTYSTIAQFHPAGMIERETFGTQTPLYQKKRYNNRLQLGDLRLSTGSDALSYDRGALLFLHGPNAVANTDPFANDPTNNGNLVKQLHYVPIAGGGEVVPQVDNYTYDALNRISSVVEPNVFTQTYGYDRWGNRRITGATGGVNNYNPAYDTGSNRIVGPGYDKAGNITSDVLTGGTMIYDAENRLLTATAGGGGIYAYNADGKRTRRTAGGQETWYVYGLGGELLAEYAADGAPSAPRKEYGYRGGQILIIAESGSGGGVSLVKPASQSGVDIGGQAGSGTDGDADGLFVADEPIADLEFNEDSGSTIADVSSDNNTGTLIDGAAGTTAGGHGNALSFNGVGGESLAGYPPAAAPSAPRKEYGNRGGRSIATVQSGGVIIVNPTANQSPDPGLGGAPVNSPTNLGHSSTQSSVSQIGVKGSGSQTKTCLWHSFSGVTGTKTRVTLKFDWTLNASINVSAGDEFASADASYDFRIEYSLDNGSTWTVGRGLNDSVSIPDGTGGSDGDGINTSGSESIDLPNPGSIDITQIRVRDRIFSSAALRLSNNGSASSNATAYVSLIRLEVDTVPVITGVSSGSVTHNSATISWTTNEPADSQVEYGTTTAYGHSTALEPALVTAHSQGLSGLTPGMQYHYRVKSRDATGNLASSGDSTFTTAQNGSGGIKWLVTDYLGSTRMVIDETGSLAGITRHDFLPFGEELSAGVGIRSASNGYSGDSVRQKFTGYERDSETGVDFAGARYFGNLMGRFTSPDDFLNDTHVSDPQSWNLYVHARNNPLRYIDPDGKIKKDADGNVIFDVDSTGTITFFENVPIRDADGNPTGYTETITWEAEIGHVYADDGTPIEASRATGPMKVVVKDSGGNISEELSSLRAAAYASIGFNNTTDCHGNTFAIGQVWINNDQVGKILSGDNYYPLNPNKTAPEVNDVGIYSKPGVGILHSVLVNSIEDYNDHFVRDDFNPYLVEVNSVISKGGITPKTVAKPGPGPGAAWHNPTAELKYYRQRLNH